MKKTILISPRESGVRVCVCVSLFISTHTYLYIYICIHYLHTHIHMFVCARPPARVVGVHVRVQRACVRACMCVCVYVYVCVCVCAPWVCLCEWGWFCPGLLFFWGVVLLAHSYRCFSFLLVSGVRLWVLGRVSNGTSWDWGVAVWVGRAGFSKMGFVGGFIAFEPGGVSGTPKSEWPQKL